MKKQLALLLSLTPFYTHTIVRTVVTQATKKIIMKDLTFIQCQGILELIRDKYSQEEFNQVLKDAFDGLLPFSLLVQFKKEFSNNSEQFYKAVEVVRRENARTRDGLKLINNNPFVMAMIDSFSCNNQNVKRLLVRLRLFCTSNDSFVKMLVSIQTQISPSDLLQYYIDQGSDSEKLYSYLEGLSQGQAI